MEIHHIKKDILLASKNAKLCEDILNAYKVAIDMNIDSLSHPLIAMNTDYFVNKDYQSELKFLAAWYVEDKYRLILSALYVDSEYRNIGYGKKILQMLQNSWTNGFIQLAVKVGSPKYVADLYLKMGFKSDAHFGIKRPNSKYLDFFWSKTDFFVTWDQERGYSITPRITR